MKDEFTNSEWEELLESPKIIFSAISQADDKIQEKEIEAFKDFIKAKRRFSSELMKEILPDDVDQYTLQLDEFNLTPGQIKDKIININRYVTFKLDEKVSKSFKYHLLALAFFIANSSGKLLQEKISDVEFEKLVSIFNYFNLDTHQIMKTTLIEDIIKLV